MRLKAENWLNPNGNFFAFPIWLQTIMVILLIVLAMMQKVFCCLKNKQIIMKS